jgi:hypothetical protein
MFSDERGRLSTGHVVAVEKKGGIGCFDVEIGKGLKREV